jgi:hypothetical protein
MPDAHFSQVATEKDYNNDHAMEEWNSQVPLAAQVVSQFISCELGTYKNRTFSCTLRDVKKEELLVACECAFSKR